MPLLKLWKSLCGRSNESVRSDNSEGSQESPTKPAKAAKPTSRGLLGMGKGPHAGLCKKLKGIAATSVLEINVGDGTRAAAVIEVLRKHSDEVRYAAIDQFEMSDGPVSLKEFHQSLRASEIKAQIFPNPLAPGLIRLASTIGSVDLVLIAVDVDQWQDPAVLPLIHRVSHAKTVVLYLDGEDWVRFESKGESIRRAA